MLISGFGLLGAAQTVLQQIAEVEPGPGGLGVDLDGLLESRFGFIRAVKMIYKRDADVVPKIGLGN